MKFVNPFKILASALSAKKGMTFGGNNGRDSLGCVSRSNHGFKRNKRRAMKRACWLSK